MTEKWIGITNTSEEVVVVYLEVHQGDGVTIYDDQTWKLQNGERAAAYCTMYERILNYISENGIRNVVIKGSAVSTGTTRLAHLKTAELRGVIMTAAAHTNARVTEMTKSLVSKKLGTRRADQYVSDDSFWDHQIADGTLRKGSREAVLLILAAKGKE
jgi:Holliday junction resolvasome RuvABC endonuclease subunit